MLDYITLIATGLPDDYAEAFKNTSGRKINDLGAETYYDTKVRDMRLHLAHQKTKGWVLTVKGSVKVFKNGENFSFMDFAQTTAALQELAAFVGLAPQQLSVTSLEVSVPVPTAPIDRLVSRYGQWEFIPMVVPKKKSGPSGKSYGVRAMGSDDYFSIKMYRKNEEQQIRHGRKVPQIQQLEFCIDEPRYLRDKLKRAGIPSDSSLKGGVALSDLMKPEVQHILCGLLADIPNHLTFKTDEMAQPDYDAILLANPGMTKKTLLDLVAFAYRPYRELLKAKSRTRYFDLQKDFTRLRDQLCPSSDKELCRFQQALQAAVEAGRPTEASPIIYTGKQSRKKDKKTALVSD